MSFFETVEKARAFLARNRRISLRGLQREFELGDDALDELVDQVGRPPCDRERALRREDEWRLL